MFHTITTENKNKAQADGTRAEPPTKSAWDASLGHTERLAPASPVGAMGQVPARQRSQKLASLQQAHGNQAVLRMIEQQRRNPQFDKGAANRYKLHQAQASFTVPPGILQAKFMVGPVDDPLEQEADQVADQVMQIPDTDIAAAPPRVSRKCAVCAEEQTKKLQTKLVGLTEPTASIAPPIVHEVLQSPGQTLDAVTRAFFEPRFGYNFSHVRVHYDNKTEASAKSVGALAYTVGSHIAFSSAQYSPQTTGGRRLLAHELTHVIQQSGGGELPLARQAAEKLPPQSSPSLRLIPGGAGRTAEGAAKELAEREAAQIIERAGWREFWKVVAERFAVKEGIAAALALADGPLPIGDLIALGIELWIIWDIIELWDDLWAEANSSVQPAPGPAPAPQPQPQPQSRRGDKREDCKNNNLGFIDCEGLSDVYEVVQDYLLNSTNYSFNALGECREVKALKFGAGVIEACNGAPGEVYHCSLKGTKDYISVFGCYCCDEEGSSGIDWRGPHINGP